MNKTYTVWVVIVVVIVVVGGLWWYWDNSTFFGMKPVPKVNTAAIMTPAMMQMMASTSAHERAIITATKAKTH